MSEFLWNIGIPYRFRLAWQYKWGNGKPYGWRRVIGRLYYCYGNGREYLT